MSDNPSKIWIEHYDLNLGVQGSDSDTLEEVRAHFDELLAEAVERDPKLGEGVDVGREIQ